MDPIGWTTGLVNSAIDRGFKNYNLSLLTRHWTGGIFKSPRSTFQSAKLINAPKLHGLTSNSVTMRMEPFKAKTVGNSENH